MKSLAYGWAFFAFLMIALFPPAASALVTTDEAQNLVERGIAYYLHYGEEKAIEAFNDPNGEFVKGELYVFLIKLDGTTLAHGGDAAQIGKNVLDLTDAKGKLFIQEFIRAAKAGGGWVDYQWTNPVSKKIQDKSSYIKPIEGTDLFIGCGIYK